MMIMRRSKKEDRKRNTAETRAKLITHYEYIGII